MRALFIGILLLELLALGALVAAQPEPTPPRLAQAQAAPKADPLTPSDVAQWRAYAGQLEVDLKEKARLLAGATATLDVVRAELDKVQKRVVALEGAMKAAGVAVPEPPKK